MKRILALALMLVMCLSTFALVACDMGGRHESSTVPPTQAEVQTQPDGTKPEGETNGGDETTGDNTANQPKPLEYDVVAYDGSEVTITFSHTMNATYQGVLDQYIAKFNEMYPNITIEHAQVGGYDEVRDQIKTELTAGNQPNIAYCYPDQR